MKDGVIYVGSDGSVKNGVGAHSFAFTSGATKSSVWGGAAPTPGNCEEMSSQRSEHAGSIAALLLLDILFPVLGVTFTVSLWVDNAEVVRRGKANIGALQWKDTIILDYDLWALSASIASVAPYSLTWEKVDSHIDSKLKEDPTRVLQGNKLAWRINEVADRLAEQQRVKGYAVVEQFFFRGGIHGRVCGTVYIREYL